MSPQRKQVCIDQWRRRPKLREKAHDLIEHLLDDISEDGVLSRQALDLALGVLKEVSEGGYAVVLPTVTRKSTILLDDDPKCANEYVCALCESDVREAEEGVYRHAHDPWDDASAFCEKYGYPVPVKERLR